MRRRKKLASVEQVTHICAWCGRQIEEETELFSLGAKARPGVMLPGPTGGVISMSLRPQVDKTIYALVPTSTSQAKREGNDLLFVLCSRACALALKSTLQQQLDFADRYN